VRLEIEAGLKRDLRVIPILVDGAPMPSSSDLPPSLHGLPRRQSVTLTHGAFGTDADKLIATLSRLPAFVGGRSGNRSKEPLGSHEFSVQKVLQVVEIVPIDGRWTYKWPSIPPFKESNARSKAGVPSEEEIAVLMDLTHSGSAKDSLLLGRRRLYYCCWQSASPVAAIPYSDLREHDVATQASVTRVGWMLILLGLAFFWVFLIPTVVALLAILRIGAVGSVVTIGPHRMFIRYNRSKQVFAILRALKGEIGR